MECGVCKQSVFSQTIVAKDNEHPAVNSNSEGPMRESRESSGLGRSLNTVTGTPTNGVAGKGSEKRASSDDVTGSDVDSLLDSGRDLDRSKSHPPKWDMSTGHALPTVGSPGGDQLPSAEEVCNVLNDCLQDTRRGMGYNSNTKRVFSVSSNTSKYTISGLDDDDYDAELEFLLSRADRVNITRGGGSKHHISKDSVYHSASQVDNLSYSTMSSIFSSTSVASWSDSCDSLIEEDRSPSVNSLQSQLARARADTRMSQRLPRPPVRPVRPNAARRRNLELFTVSWSSNMRQISDGLPAAVS